MDSPNTEEVENQSPHFVSGFRLNFCKNHIWGNQQEWDIMFSRKPPNALDWWCFLVTVAVLNQEQKYNSVNILPCRNTCDWCNLPSGLRRRVDTFPSLHEHEIWFIIFTYNQNEQVSNQRPYDLVPLNYKIKFYFKIWKKNASLLQ